MVALNRKLRTGSGYFQTKMHRVYMDLLLPDNVT